VPYLCLIFISFDFFFNSRIKRQATSPPTSIVMQLEVRDEPRPSTTVPTGIGAQILSNIISTIINRYQAGELQVAWRSLYITNDTCPSNLSTKEPFDDFEVALSVIYRLVLVTPPSECRQESPCTIQPVLVAYDIQGNVIQKLGSNDYPWQVTASCVNQSNIILSGGIANYTNGQTQFSLLSIPYIGSCEVQFTLNLPNGVDRYR
jgi:hypothetical protein